MSWEKTFRVPTLAENVLQSKNPMKKSYKKKNISVKFWKERFPWSMKTWNSKGTPGGHQTPLQNSLQPTFASKGSDVAL